MNDAARKEYEKPTIRELGKLPPTAEELASNEMIWLIAKLCHENNREFCSVVCGEHGSPSWEDAPPEIRQSVYEGVVNVVRNPDITPKESHQAWMDYKLAEGWTFGNRKDFAEKTHPNLIPFEQLHVNERFKDHLFLTTCKTLIGAL